MWINEEYQHNGYGQEILEKLLDFIFYGIHTEVLLANARNCEKAAYRILNTNNFEIYNYVPKKNPESPDTLVQFRMTKAAYYSSHPKAECEYNYTPPEKKKSPYSYSHPIRKIDSIIYKKQPTGYLCGQAVVAMLADVSVDEVI
ncbi:MAG: hypothetical protein EOM87_09975, partial [Clostridia bacterium]|nr:hypothetical protein [Clostridia bacterium]